MPTTAQLLAHAQWIRDTYPAPDHRPNDRSNDIRARLYEIADDIERAAGQTPSPVEPEDDREYLD
jgi:hypothetical protein